MLLCSIASSSLILVCECSKSCLCENSMRNVCKHVKAKKVNYSHTRTVRISQQRRFMCQGPLSFIKHLPYELIVMKVFIMAAAAVATYTLLISHIMRYGKFRKKYTPMLKP